MVIIKKTRNNNFGEDVEYRKPSSTVGKDVLINWYSYYGKHFGGSSKS